MSASKPILFLMVAASLAAHLILYNWLNRRTTGVDESRHHALVEVGYVEVVQHTPPAELPREMARPRPDVGRRRAQAKTLVAEPGSGTQSIENTLAVTLPATSDAERNDALARYIADVRARIDRAKIYPPTASEREQEGLVVIGLSLDRSGHITKYAIESPSPYRLLNEAAERAVRGAQFINFPPELTGEELHLHIPVAFRIDHK